ncbi:MAG: hypothetical protein DBX06_04675 [Candidatus Poseidoniales archaeon]|nr:MAG: hypothetical protein DBX06_04675 [Candidatus Poseidoniales archaeon]
MEGASMFKMPTIDLSAKSLLMFSQLGFFVCFTYWFSQGAESNSDYLFPALFAISGLALFLSVPNARMGVTLGVPAFMIVMGLATGENEMMFWAVFMLLMFGPVAYMPALASGDSTLGLEDGDRTMRLGIVWLAFTLLMVFMMSSLVQAAQDGEWTEEDFDESEYTMSIDSTEQTIAQVGLGLAVIGILVFLLTALVGMELGPMLPWHGGAMTAGALLIGQYLWLVADGGPDYNLASEVIFILSLVGLIALPPCIGYRSSDDTTESE